MKGCSTGGGQDVKVRRLLLANADQTNILVCIKLKVYLLFQVQRTGRVSGPFYLCKRFRVKLY